MRWSVRRPGHNNTMMRWDAHCAYILRQGLRVDAMLIEKMQCCSSSRTAATARRSTSTPWRSAKTTVNSGDQVVSQFGS